ncbi:MAG: LysR family transcriptional regulator, partial [Clostridia bacterium]|nr:LysR family transcriptional regulator [Clostridia bacterium]
MTIQQIQYLLTIVRTGSLNRAAEQLYVSQPTLTGVVKSLEEELGITLFNRTNRGVTLTPEGTD